MDEWRVIRAHELAHGCQVIYREFNDRVSLQPKELEKKRKKKADLTDDDYPTHGGTMRQIRILLALVLLPLTGCGASGDEVQSAMGSDTAVVDAEGSVAVVDTAAIGEQLMEKSREWSRVANEGTLEETLSFWADDAVMMVPGQQPLRGKEAIREFVASTADIEGFSVSWEPVEAHVSVDGTMAYLIERNRMTMPDASGETMTQRNKVVTVWEKQPDGSWKNVVDMWNALPAEESGDRDPIGNG